MDIIVTYLSSPVLVKSTPTPYLGTVAAYLPIVRASELHTKRAMGQSRRLLKQQVGPTRGRPENSPIAPANARQPDRSKHCAAVLGQRGPACAVFSSQCITPSGMCAISRRTLVLIKCGACSQLLPCSPPCPLVSLLTPVSALCSPVAHYSPFPLSNKVA